MLSRLAGGQPGRADAPFAARVDDPLRQWKLSPMERLLPAGMTTRRARRDAEGDRYQRAPWYIVRSDDKRKGG